MAAKTYIYSDINSQLYVTPEGNVQILYDVDVIAQSIRTILSTIPGERVMNPEFGSNLYNLLFEPMDEYTLEEIQDTIMTSITRWENRVSVDLVHVFPNEDRNFYDINIHITIVPTGQQTNIKLKVKNFSG